MTSNYNENKNDEDDSEKEIKIHTHPNKDNINPITGKRFYKLKSNKVIL